MRTLLAVALLLNGMVVLGVCYTEMTASAQEGGTGTCTEFQNGNANGDATLDLSDAVYILNFLFIGGPAPNPRFVADWECVAASEAELAACRAERDACASDLQSCQAERDAALSELEACQTERDTALADLATCNAEKETVLASLTACELERDAYLVDLETCQAELARCVQPPATGQTRCYDDSVPANEIPCSSTDFPGQDGFYQAGCPTQDRFVDNLDGTVTDTCTGLMWEKSTAPGTHDWQAALQYCDRLELAGHRDWRLPNLRELRTLVDYGGAIPAIDPVFQAIAEMYWTSSSFGDDLTHAWTVGFQEGEGNPHEAKVDPFPVRAVRGGL